MISKQYIICDPAIRQKIEAIGIRLSTVEEHHLGSIYEAESNSGNLRADLQKLGYDRSIRVMDRYHIVDGGSRERRQLLNDILFEWLAENYRSAIDVSANIENMQILGGLLEGAIGSLDGSVVVDFGCGIGLAIEAFANRQVELIGVDRCAAMRRLAAESGMRAESPGAFARRPVGSVDGAYSSYVFHLSPGHRSIKLLWSRIRKGGCFVGNFHKGIGVDEVCRLMCSLGANVEHCSAPDEFARHGNYVRFKKE